jgi:hypothetical protein
MLKSRCAASYHPCKVVGLVKAILLYSSVVRPRLYFSVCDASFPDQLVESFGVFDVEK